MVLYYDIQVTEGGGTSWSQVETVYWLILLLMIGLSPLNLGKHGCKLGVEEWVVQIGVCPRSKL